MKRKVNVRGELREVFNGWEIGRYFYLRGMRRKFRYPEKKSTASAYISRLKKLGCIDIVKGCFGETLYSKIKNDETVTRKFKEKVKPKKIRTRIIREFIWGENNPWEDSKHPIVV